MTDINIPAVATGAFLGLLALVASVACIPPITRFLGDLFCCPWRIPFTKKKRRNADEELGKDELPYVVEPRPNTAVDDEGYQNMSEAYMSAVNVVDPELAKEEARRSAERRSAEYRQTHGLRTEPYQHPNNSAYSYYSREHSPPRGYHREHSPPRDYHHEHHYGNHLDVSPHRAPAHGGNWRGASRERSHSYSPERAHGYERRYPAPHPQNMSDPYLSEGYSPEHYPSQDYVGVQRPRPSHAYSPPEMHHAAGYFPNMAYNQRDYDGHYQATERLVQPRQNYPNM